MLNLASNDPTDDCKIDKTKFYPCEVKCRTIGVLIASRPCGIVIGYAELFGSESLPQTTLFLNNLIKSGANNTEIIVYDNACHLKRYALPVV